MISKSPFKQDKCAEAKAKKKAEYMSRKSKTTLPGIALTHHLVFRVYFVILTILKILQNFALHGEN